MNNTAPIITKLALQNVKGTATASHDFTPATVVTGGNFAGKTTILQAIILASRGHLPALGKTNGATFAMASGPIMKVQLLFSNGQTIARQWKQSGKKINTEHVGEVPPINFLAADEFTSAKPSERLAMLASTAGAKLAELDTVTDEVLKEYGGPRPTGWETSLERAQMVIDDIKADAKDSRARKVQFEKGLASLVELAATPPARPVDTAAALQAAERNAAGAANTAAGAEAAEEAGAAAIDALAAWLDSHPDARTPANVNSTAELEKLLAQRAELTAQKGQMERDMAECRRTISAGAAAPADAAETIASLRPLRATDWQALLTKSESRVNEIGRISGMASRDLKGVQTEIEKANKLTCCPTCGADGESWKAAKLAELTTKEQQLKTDLEALETERVAMDARVLSAHNGLQGLATLDALEQAMAGAVAAEAAQDKLIILEHKAEEMQEQEEELNDTIENLKAARQDVEQHAAAHERYLTLSRAVQGVDLITLQNAAAVARQVAENAAAAVETAEEAHAAEEPARAAWAAHMGREKDIQAAQQQAEEETAKLEKLEAAAARLATARDAQLKKLYGPVIAAAEAMSAGLLKTTLTLHPDTAEIGRWNEEKTGFISFGVMSGAEQIIAVSALQMALATTGSGILMMDEISRMTEETKAAFLAKIHEALDSGALAQAILFDHSAAGYPNDWTKITV